MKKLKNYNVKANNVFIRLHGHLYFNTDIHVHV